MPTQKQIDSLITVLTKWCKIHKLSSTSINGHFDVPGGSTKTSCPGKNLKSLLDNIRQKIQVKLNQP